MSDRSYTDEQLWEVFEDPQARIRMLEAEVERLQGQLDVARAALGSALVGLQNNHPRNAFTTAALEDVKDTLSKL